VIKKKACFHWSIFIARDKSCMPIQLTLLGDLCGFGFMYVTFRCLDTHFICNLCWGGIMVHKIFSVSNL